MRWWRALKVTHASCKATGLVTIFFFMENSQLICFRGPAEISPEYFHFFGVPVKGSLISLREANP